MNFASDNWAGVSPRVLAALAAANDGYAPAYGADAHTESAIRAFAAAFEHPVAMVTVPTGTAANALAIDLTCGNDGVLVCHEEAHVVASEAASRPKLNPGVAFVTIKGVGHRISPADLERALADVPGGRRGCLSLTNSTESGTVLTAAEVGVLSAIARRRGLAVHVDGARFGNAVAATGSSPAELSWKAGVDVLSFGATKNGTLSAEAVLAFDPNLQNALLPRRKAYGYTFSKGRFASAQLEAYLAGGHWLDLAAAANRVAARLAAGLAARGIDLAWPADANEAFPILDAAVADRMRAAGARFHDWMHLLNLDPRRPLRPGEKVIRLVASFASTDAEADAWLALLDAERR